MTNAYVIQISGRTAGIVARDQGDQAYYFFAATHAFHPLEGLPFEAPHQAERAARVLNSHNILPRAFAAATHRVPR